MGQNLKQRDIFENISVYIAQSGVPGNVIISKNSFSFLVKT